LTMLSLRDKVKMKSSIFRGAKLKKLLLRQLFCSGINESWLCI